MDKFKAIVEKYFTSFTYFYRYLHHKIFVAFFLSIVVSTLDIVGLTMFFPLLQVVGGSETDPDSLGKLKILIEGIEKLGIPMTLISVLLIMFIFFVFKGIAKYISSVYIVVLQQSFIRRIRLKLLNLLNLLSFKKFILSDAGRIQNTMSGEVDRVSQAFRTYFMAVQHGIMIAVYIVAAFLVDWQFAILVSIGGGLTNFLYKYVYDQTRGASRKLTRYNHTFQGEIIQHVGHFKYLKATGMVKKYGDRLKKTIFKIELSRRKIGVLNSISNAAREPLLVCVIGLVIFTQVHFFGSKMGAIILSLLFFYRALSSLMDMQQQWNGFLAVSGSLENMQDFQKYLRENTETDGKEELIKFEKEISLNNLSFSYGDTSILHNINLNIKKNSSMAFVGESGSGKTTLVNLIAGLLYADKGTLKIDHQDLKNLRKESYQKRIGYVSQDPVIFNDTIYNNVTFWAEKTPENIEKFNRSVEQSSLKEFLEELPEGEKTTLGNNGINLSGGQKQRVSIARELYKNVELLILDEATSALDSETERAIQNSIDALQGQYTILIVAHRLATIRNVDQVVLMDKGHIIDVDSFENLAKKQDRFRKMVELQEL